MVMNKTAPQPQREETMQRHRNRPPGQQEVLRSEKKIKISVSKFSDSLFSSTTKESSEELYMTEYCLQTWQV